MQQGLKIWYYKYFYKYIKFVKRLSIKDDKWGERRNKIYDQTRGIELWTVFIEWKNAI